MVSRKELLTLENYMIIIQYTGCAKQVGQSVNYRFLDQCKKPLLFFLIGANVFNIQDDKVNFKKDVFHYIFVVL